MVKFYNYLFTWNNYPNDYKDILSLFFKKSCKYILFAPEVGDNGTLQIQGYFHFNHQMSMCAVNKNFGNTLCLKQTEGNIIHLNYKTKPANPLTEEWGIRPMSQKLKGEAGKKTNNNRTSYKFDQLPPEKIKTTNSYVCQICNKKYKFISGLSRHKNTSTCMQTTLATPSSKELINEISDLRKTVIELSKNMPIQHIHSPTINNSHNNTFNLQIFLNETCKNAINIGEFVDRIKISLRDLESIGNSGYVAGISNIIIKNLASLDETQRPVHCSDVKRETLYVKDNDTWEKEQDGNPKIINAVKHISSKSIGQLKSWRDANPGFDDPSSHNSDTYQTLVRESCESSDEKDTKIIKKVAKKTAILRER
jgi:hypothetical protein